MLNNCIFLYHRRHQENICETDDKNDEAWMKKTPLTEANIKEMLDNFISCRHTRRRIIESDNEEVTATYILNRYLRLMDHFEAVSDVLIYVASSCTNPSFLFCSFHITSCKVTKVTYLKLILISGWQNVPYLATLESNKALRLKDSVYVNSKKESCISDFIHVDTV
jgi:hypothetical protein